MITHCQLPLKFDVARLAADLHEIESADWPRHFVSQNYTGDWTALALRSLSGSAEDIHADPHPQSSFRDTPILHRSTYFQAVLSEFKCPLSAVRLMRLGPGGEIKQHCDPGTGYEFGELRLHIPITTNAQVEFHIGGQLVVMRPGTCWYLNFALPHSVRNSGSSARIHLVIDCDLNPWLDAMFVERGFGAIERYGTKASLFDNHIAGLRQLHTPAARDALAAILQQKSEIEAARRARAEQPIALHTAPE